MAMYLLYFSYTDVIRIRATKIGSFRKKICLYTKKKPEAAMRLPAFCV